MSDIPLVAGPEDANGIIVPGISAPPDHPLSAKIVLIGPSFFDTMQIPLLVGRSVGKQNSAGGQRVVVVNEVFARKFFPSRNVIGRHFQFEDAPPIDVQIIGSPKTLGIRP